MGSCGTGVVSICVVGADSGTAWSCEVPDRQKAFALKRPEGGS